MWLGVFEAFPGARRVCSEHVIGAGEGASHIEWTQYATEAEPDDVREFYATHPSREERGGPEVVFLRSGPALLWATPASAIEGKIHCDRPAPTDATIIIVSELFAGSPPEVPPASSASEPDTRPQARANSDAACEAAYGLALGDNVTLAIENYRKCKGPKATKALAAIDAAAVRKVKSEGCKAKAIAQQAAEIGAAAARRALPSSCRLGR